MRQLLSSIIDVCSPQSPHKSYNGTDVRHWFRSCSMRWRCSVSWHRWPSRTPYLGPMCSRSQLIASERSKWEYIFKSQHEERRISIGESPPPTSYLSVYFVTSRTAGPVCSYQLIILPVPQDLPFYPSDKLFLIGTPALIWHILPPLHLFEELFFCGGQSKEPHECGKSILVRLSSCLEMDLNNQSLMLILSVTFKIKILSNTTWNILIPVVLFSSCFAILY